MARTATMQAIFSSSFTLILTLVLANAHKPSGGGGHGHGGGGHGHGGGGHGHGGGGHGSASGPWKDAHATFYGSPDGSGTIDGACGYSENEDKNLFGIYTTALSTTLFKEGQECGACFEIKCAKGNEYCLPGEPSVVVTATNLCPPGGWCSPPKDHFDLSQPAFCKIAESKGGMIPVQYRRVPCKTQGGIHFKITGNPTFNLVSVTNVGGAGDVVKVEVQAGDGQWLTMKRNYGAKFEVDSKITGQKLNFRITTSDGKQVVTQQAAPENWQFGQTFEGLNFH